MWCSLRRRPIVVLVTSALAAAGCGCAESDDGVPTTLFDGSAAVVAEVAFEGIGVPVVVTKVERVAPAQMHLRRDSCLESLGGRPAAAPAVVRIGAQSESVTVREASARAVRGCDNGAGPREADRRWCGIAYGWLRNGRLLDPRLDLLCTTEDGEPLAFVWVEPHPGARFVLVDQGGFAEAYETAGDIPVRIAFTTGIDLGRSAARVEVSEHAASGGLVRRRIVDARVAG